MSRVDTQDTLVPSSKEAPLTESTRYLGETAFGTVEKVYAVCMVVNDQVADPKMAEKIYNYIQDVFGSEALEYDQAVASPSREHAPPHTIAPMLKKDIEPLW